jgi:hypothetical protein
LAKVITKFRRESDFWEENRSKKFVKTNRTPEKSHEKKMKLRQYQEQESYIDDNEDYSQYSNIRFK